MKMVERFRGLNIYQKGVLLFMAAMILVFAAVYAVTISREGFSYRGAIFIPSQEDGSTVYSGKIKGEPASFTVTENQTAVYRLGDKTYGPYIFREDPAAVPKAPVPGEEVTGVELRLGDEILFRGGMENSDYRLLYNEDGSVRDLGIAMTVGSGVQIDENGNVIDPEEPSVFEILELFTGPELMHRGAWGMWFYGVLACILTAVSVLFADELFHWGMSFHIQNAELAEPSELEIAGRYIAWTVLPFLAMALFIAGLSVSPV